MRRHRHVIVLIALVGLMMLAGGCQVNVTTVEFVPASPPRPTRTPRPTADTSVVGEITFAGSTTVQPLAHLLGEAYGTRCPNVTLNIAAGGSRVGIEAIHDGTVDIGMASRNLKPEEAEGITQHKIAVDVIAVVVQASNTVQNMTLAELRDIYLGKITRWDALGGEERPILVVIRGENSGTRGAFDAIVLGGEAPAAPNLRIAVTAGDMAAIVGDNPDAIGYVGFGNFEPDLMPVAIDGILPAKKAAQDESYQLVRPLLLLTGPLTQPLAHTFIDFARSAEGQRVVEENGWVPAR